MRTTTYRAGFLLANDSVGYGCSADSEQKVKTNRTKMLTTRTPSTAKQAVHTLCTHKDSVFKGHHSQKHSCIVTG